MQFQTGDNYLSFGQVESPSSYSEYTDSANVIES